MNLLDLRFKKEHSMKEVKKIDTKTKKNTFNTVKIDKYRRTRKIEESNYILEYGKYYYTKNKTHIH